MAFGGIIGRQTTTYTNEEIDGMIQGLQQQIAGGLKIETGSYIGNGQYGEANALSIAFTNQPWIVWIYNESFITDGLNHSLFFNCYALNSIYYGYGAVCFNRSYQTITPYAPHARMVGYTLYWYGDNNTQYWANLNNQTYKWFAICS